MSSNNRYSLLILFSLLLLLIFDSSNLTVAGACLGKCGEIDIPYPFGIGMGCYLEKWYEIECVNDTSTSGKLVPFLSIIRNEVVSISLPDPLVWYYLSSQNRLSYGSVHIKNPITSNGCSNDGEELGSLLNLTGTPFYVSFGNSLIVVGCNNTASLTNVEPSMVGCRSRCGVANYTASEDYFMSINCNTKPLTVDDRIQSCYGTRIVDEGICKVSMPNGIQKVVGVKIDDNNTTTGGCKVAFLEYHSYSYDSYSFVNTRSPRELYDAQDSTVELGWFIHTTNVSFVDSLRCQNISNPNEMKFINRTSCACDYNAELNYASCACTRGYRGNPYLPGGCKDIDECLEKYPNGDQHFDCGRGLCVNLEGGYHCVIPKPPVTAIELGAGFGSLIFIAGLYWLYKFIRKQRKLNQKKKFFKRNGGLLLQQQLTSKEGKVEKTRVFSSRELEKATENFSLNRILGQGGQGTVYKGMLVDGRIVAVKKSKVVDEDKLEEFINEIVILSQINHRNIVKLLGCCLETNVPVLVYEFISNGNLFEHLHNEYDDYTMVTWDVRLRIAVDIAGALSYLHSYASSPIYHRDVKSTNIMLDEKYRAKVSDFGTSRSITVDQTHLTTVVSGTVGYMDPEYFQSSQFTEKSDVYSFGVVLVELITGEKSVSFLRSQENRTLSTYFTLAMKDNKLSDIIDIRIRDGCNLNQVTAAAKIAKRCLNLKREKRPNMREVLMELERTRLSLGDSNHMSMLAKTRKKKRKGSWKLT